MLRSIIQEKFKNKKFKTMVSVVGSLIIFLFLFLFLKPDIEFTDNAYLKSDIVVIKPKVIGHIVKAIASDNQFLKSGQLIAKIDDRDYRLKLQQAKENFNIAKANLETVLYQVKIVDLETKNALSTLEAAKSSLETHQKEFERHQALINEKAVSQSAFDQAKTSFLSAKSNFVNASSKYESNKHKQEIVSLESEQAKSGLSAAENSLQLAQLELNNTEIKAPTDGIVSKKNLQIGQLVSPNVSLGYFVQDDIWIIANFKESQIGKIRKGQKVRITIDSQKVKELKGKIDSISPATGAEFSILPPENGTGNFTKIVQRVPVKIIFDENQDLSLLRSGLSCEVKVLLK